MQHLAHTAQTIAYVAHAGQTDKAGADYFGHAARVAYRVAAKHPGRDDLIATAWLHDVIEDTHVSLHDLAAAGIPDDVLHLVGVLTHGPGITRRDYVARIIEVGGPDAVEVKLADIADNSASDRLALLPDADRERLIRKYSRDREQLGVASPSRCGAGR